MGVCFLKLFGYQLFGVIRMKDSQKLLLKEYTEGSLGSCVLTASGNWNVTEQALGLCHSDKT